MGMLLSVHVCGTRAPARAMGACCCPVVADMVHVTYWVTYLQCECR